VATPNAQEEAFVVRCPHCKKPFEAAAPMTGPAARYRGFKCPHCRLFVPYERAAEQDLIDRS
jgi:hypothetical protein